MHHLLQQSVTLHFVQKCIYGFCMMLRGNSDYFPKQHYAHNLCNGEVLCFLCTKNRIITYYSDALQLQRVKATAIQNQVAQPMKSKQVSSSDICTQMVSISETFTEDKGQHFKASQ
jgi:hypothetical protein